MGDWGAHLEREAERYADGRRRLPHAPDADARQRQLARLANAAYGAGLASLMGGEAQAARGWLARAAERYRESSTDAPAGSWGRPIGALKARVLASDWDGAGAEARWALGAGAAEAESPIGAYAAALAACVLEDYGSARVHADGLRIRDDFPHAVGEALASIAAEDVPGYLEAIEAVLESFESRNEYLAGVPVADTVVALQALAARRGMAVELESDLLP